MKKFWLVLCSLSLMAVFTTPAAAVDVKFSGEFYVAGDYYNRTGAYDGRWSNDPIPVWIDTKASTAFFHQRLRMQTEFIVSPGLSLITRFDALERLWGDSSWSGTRGGTFGRPSGSSGSGDRAQENIEFERAYIKYSSGKAGNFIVGYAPWGTWGTKFGDSDRSDATIQWSLLFGKWTVGAQYVKREDGSTNYKTLGTGTGNRNDNDLDIYAVYWKYMRDNFDSGLKVAYIRDARGKGTSAPAAQETNGWIFTPYVIAQIGPVKLQGEVEYWRGRIEWVDEKATDIRALAAYGDARVAIGPAYVGGLFAYASGNDAAKPNKKRSDIYYEYAWGGVDFKPTLILWNEDITKWAGNITGLRNGMTNAKLYQIYAGVPVKDFDFKVSLSYARANEINGHYTAPAPANIAKGPSYGWELDGTATYKITNNLSYMVGAGYLWTGNYFRPINETKSPKNFYLLTNKLTLTF